MEATKPPQSAIRAEARLLGSMLLWPDVVGIVANVLAPSDFWSERNAAIFAAIVAVSLRGDVDILTVIAELGEAVECAGGALYLSELLDCPAIKSHVADDAWLVRQVSATRGVTWAAMAIVDNGREYPEDVAAFGRSARDGMKTALRELSDAVRRVER